MIIGCPKCHLRYDMTHRNPKDPVLCRCGASFMVPNLSDTARAWNCPNCGGATDPAKPSCDFCGVYLAFARCPDCLSLAFEGAKFCHQCGGDLRKTAHAEDDKPTAMDCPRCQSKLHARQIDAYSVEHCRDCGGVWLDHEVLEQILNHQGKRKTAQTWLRDNARISPIQNQHKITYLKCPHCTQLMHRRNFGKTSGIIVDECAAHGIWFDSDELAAVIQFSQQATSPVAVKQASGNIPSHSRIQEFNPLRDNSHRSSWSIAADLLDAIPGLFK